ncbi:MAG: alpha,alpha-trehalase TreF [Spirosomataceae bacterium]
MSTTTKYLHQMGELFEVVQLKSVFADNKTFPDCIPNKPLNEICELFKNQKNNTEFDLKSFVNEHFSLPEGYELSYVSDTQKTAKEHLEELWDVLTRQPRQENSSLIPLPNPYVVPGGRFREIYYWDSYFTMLGLEVSNRFDLIQNMIDNFSYLLNQFGHIPNGNRAYYIGRSQPPFFALMLEVLSHKNGDEVFVKYLPQLEIEHRFWMNGGDELSENQTAVNRVVRLKDGEILNRFWDANDTPRPESYREDVELAHVSGQNSANLFRHLRAAAESGWDFSSRWFKEPDKFESIHTTDIIPVDLNCLLYNLEKTLAKAYLLKSEDSESNRFEALAQKRKDAIIKYCWDDTRGFFFDYDFIEQTQTNSYHLGACFPMLFEIATSQQTKQIVQILNDKFLQSGGLLTTLQFTEQQWDAPNGWAPLQWVAYRGLMNYGEFDLAKKIRENWIDLNLKVYEESGKMTEKYNVINTNKGAGGGEYPNQDGFGWTNGVLLRMMQDE